jgi:hypothetical protein
MENIAWVLDATVADVAFFVGSDAAMALETEHKALDRAVLECGVRAVLARRARAGGVGGS